MIGYAEVVIQMAGRKPIVGQDNGSGFHFAGFDVSLINGFKLRGEQFPARHVEGEVSLAQFLIQTASDPKR